MEPSNINIPVLPSTVGEKAAAARMFLSADEVTAAAVRRLTHLTAGGTDAAQTFPRVPGASLRHIALASCRSRRRKQSGEPCCRGVEHQEVLRR